MSATPQHPFATYRHPNFKDRTGQTFGNLRVVAFLGCDANGGSMWRCQCSCGKLTDVKAGNLSSGATKSCGCGARGFSQHGQSKTPEYKVWLRMQVKCRNPDRKTFDLNHAPPIAWQDFTQFLKDMGPRPSDLHCLCRVDQTMPYSPENCVWELRPEQQTQWLEHQGVRRTLSEWAKHLRIDPKTLRQRLANWPQDKALTTPKLRR